MSGSGEVCHRALDIAAHFSASHHHTLLGLTDLLLSLIRLDYNMSYNREWDRGKQTDGSWQYQGGAVHPREDEYHGDNKRRKFNNGVRRHSMNTGYALMMLVAGLRCSPKL